MNFKDVVTQRRAVNFFDPDRDVPETLLREMVELASTAPSSFNLQPWSLVVLREPDRKERLYELAMKQAKIKEAPVVLLVLGDRDAWKEGHPFVERDFREMVAAGGMKEAQHGWFVGACAKLYGTSLETQQAFACKNAGFFAMNLMLAAKSLGLDTHPMDGFDHDAVRKAFRIPDNYWIPLLMAVGYFRKDAQLAPPKWRKTYEEIVTRFD